MESSFLLLLLAVIVIWLVAQFLIPKKVTRINDHHPPPLPCRLAPELALDKIAAVLPDYAMLGRKWKISERTKNPCRIQARFLIPNDRGGFDVDILMNLLAGERGSGQAEIELSYVIMQTKNGQDVQICKDTNDLIKETLHQAEQ